MSESETEKKSEATKCPEKSEGNAKNHTQITKALIHRLRVFISGANNHIMDIPVSGDHILSSANIMNEAQALEEILKPLDKKIDDKKE